MMECRNVLLNNPVKSLCKEVEDVCLPTSHEDKDNTVIEFPCPCTAK